METKEIKEVKIKVPNGYEIDKENSTFECIKFKPIEKKSWRHDEAHSCEGFYIDSSSNIREYKVNCYRPEYYRLFATEKQAKSSLAMACISQIMTNDKRFGGVVTDKEWEGGNSIKYVIDRSNNEITTACYENCFYFLAFHTKEQCDLFLKENEDLVRDYLML